MFPSSSSLSTFVDFSVTVWLVAFTLPPVMFTLPSLMIAFELAVIDPPLIVKLDSGITYTAFFVEVTIVPLSTFSVPPCT